MSLTIAFTTYGKMWDQANGASVHDYLMHASKSFEEWFPLHSAKDHPELVIRVAELAQRDFNNASQSDAVQGVRDALELISHQLGVCFTSQGNENMWDATVDGVTKLRDALRWLEK